MTSRRLIHRWPSFVIAIATALIAAPFTAGLFAADPPASSSAGKPVAEKLATEKPATEKPAAKADKWEKEISAFEAADKQSPPPTGAVLFTGASGIRMWKTLAEDFPDQQVLNRGFGGSGIVDAVTYADRIVIPYKPRLVVIQAGGNDINGGRSPEQVFDDFKAFVEKVHAKLPDTRIAYLSMNPSPARWQQREKQQQGNELIKAYVAAGKNLDYINFWDAMLGPDGQPREDLFIKDRLHNNAEGYKIRADVVRPHLR
jgi:lysophospholipase L1-like esterase